MDFDQHISGYLAEFQRRKYSPSTLDSYGRALRGFASFLAARGIGRFQDVSEKNIEAFRLSLIERKLAPGTQESYMRAVRLLFRWMEDTRQNFANPAAGLVIRRPPRPLLPVPSVGDVKKLLARPDVSTPVGLRDRALIEVAYGCGLRRNELSKLDLFDPDFKTQCMRVQGKGSRERVVPLGKQALYWLRAYLDRARPRLLKNNVDERALWVCHKGRLTIFAVHAIVHRHAEAVGLRLSAHALRRACATHMLQRGAHPVQIQLLLGHAGLEHLSQYLRVSIRDLRKMHRNSKPGR